jgi:hypothetical protein
MCLNIPCNVLWMTGIAVARAETSFENWIIRPYRHTGRFGEQIVNAEIINIETTNLPHLEDFAGKKGTALSNILTRFDRQAGYPFAWFFYMLKGKWFQQTARKRFIGIFRAIFRICRRKMKPFCVIGLPARITCDGNFARNGF